MTGGVGGPYSSVILARLSASEPERHGRPALIDVAGITKVTRNPLPVPPGRLGTELLRLAFRQQDTISQVSDLSLGCFAVAGGHGQQLQALPLEGRIAVGVLYQQPGGAGPVVADDRSPRPANLGDHLLEPGKILGIDLPERLRLVRPARHLVPFHPAQEFCPQARIHAIRMGLGPKRGSPMASCFAMVARPSWSIEGGRRRLG